MLAIHLQAPFKQKILLSRGDAETQRKIYSCGYNHSFSPSLLYSFILLIERTQLTSPALTKHSSGSGVVCCSVFLLIFFVLSPIICTQFLPAYNRWATVNRDARMEQPACGFPRLRHPQFCGLVPQKTGRNYPARTSLKRQSII